MFRKSQLLTNISVMKKLLFFLSGFLACAFTNAQQTDLTGTWSMFEMTYKTNEGTQKMTEDQMKADSAMTEMYFMDEGKFKQTSNMADEVQGMHSWEGTWKLDGNKLVISLNIDGQMMDIVWDCEFKDGNMHLSRSSPDNSMTVINSFRRKE